MNWTRFINFLIGITGPLAAMVFVNDHQNAFAAVLVLVSIGLILARASEYQAGAISEDHYHAPYEVNHLDNAEALFLEGYFVVLTRGRKDDNLYAVMKPGTSRTLARGRTYVEAVQNAINAIAHS